MLRQEHPKTATKMNAEVRNFVFVTCLIVMLHVTSSEIFTSSLKVERMVMEEEHLLHELRRYIELQYDDKLDTFLNFYSDRLRDRRSKAEIQESLKHPNAVYHVIKGFLFDYQNAIGEDFETFRQIIKQTFGKFLSDVEDIQGARKSLLRLQSVYNLNVRDMINGDYLGFMGPPLGPMDAFEIGQTAFSDGKFNQSLEWLTASLHTNYPDPYQAQWKHMMVRPIPENVKALMGRAYLLRGDIQEAEKLYNEVKMLESEIGDVVELGKELKTRPHLQPKPEADFFHNFSRLCSLENKNHPAEPTNSRIVCRYREALLPYYRFKEELLSISPFASVFYDFVSDHESEYLKSFVQNKLKRGTVGDEGKAVVSDIRISDLAWVWDGESDLVRSLSLKISHLTGLDTSQRSPNGPASSEPFQVVNYGLGGHYEVHMDLLKDVPKLNELQYSGERIATFLIYLSDVQRGGSTVFTQAGVAVAPKKNSALFWYNCDPAHRPDEMTNHAGCPVLIGQKWICNKWIWTYGNTFRRRCGLTPDATQLDIEEDMKRGYK